MNNVVIIGAGPAGLTAAYELLKLGDKYNVVVLEESDCVGGISRTIRTGGNRMDIGGHRFFDRKEIKDMLAYLWVIHNPSDTLRLKRIINVPARRIGPKLVETLEQLARETSLPLCWGRTVT